MPATRRSLRSTDKLKDDKKEKANKQERIMKLLIKRETNNNSQSSRKKSSVSDSEVKYGSISSEDSDLSSGDEGSSENVQKRRLEIEKHKQEVIQKLNLHQAAADFSASVQTKRTPASKSKIHTRVKHEPVRKSLRIQNIEAPKLTGKEVYIEEHEISVRKPATEYEIISTGFESDGAEDENDQHLHEKEDYALFMKSFSEGKHCVKHSHHPLPSSKYYSKLKDLTSNGCLVKKVVLKRIFSMAFYPGSDRPMIAVGCKTGTIGLWDMNRKDANDGVYLFETHTRPVRTLKFSPTHSHALYSCSYDGMLRATNLNKGVYEAALLDNEDNPSTAFDFQLTSGDVIIAGCYNGDVAIIDRRTRTSKVQTFDGHNRSIKCVSVHPTKREYFATCSNDTKLKIFDVRMVSANKPKAVAVMHEHAKAIDSAFFSPISGNQLLTTSLDDRIRVYNTSEISSAIRLQTSVRHNNYTGRWLSNFQATWHPSREDVVIVGSMARPRQIEIFDQNLEHIHNISDPDLSCVCSLNCIHPTMDIIAGGNSSGRVFAFGL